MYMYIYIYIYVCGWGWVLCDPKPENCFGSFVHAGVRARDQGLLDVATRRRCRRASWPACRPPSGCCSMKVDEYNLYRVLAKIWSYSLLSKAYQGAPWFCSAVYVYFEPVTNCWVHVQSIVIWWERERERSRAWYIYIYTHKLWLYTHVCMYVYIYR